MDEKEFKETKVVPAFIEVLKAFFERNPDIRSMYRELLKNTDTSKDSDDPNFKFLMK